MMSNLNSRQKVLLWATAILTTLGSSWLIADWVEFKEGFQEGYSAQAGAEP